MGLRNRTPQGFQRYAENAKVRNGNWAPCAKRDLDLVRLGVFEVLLHLPCSPGLEHDATRHNGCLSGGTLALSPHSQSILEADRDYPRDAGKDMHDSPLLQRDTTRD
jgi:hypothetical protein